MYVCIYICMYVYLFAVCMHNAWIKYPFAAVTITITVTVTVPTIGRFILLQRFQVVVINCR